MIGLKHGTESRKMEIMHQMELIYDLFYRDGDALLQRKTGKVALVK